METSCHPQDVPGTHVFNVVNQHPVSWCSQVADTILASYPSSISVKPVSFHAWVDRLRQSMDDDVVDLERNPAIRLLDFFTGLTLSGDEARHFGSTKAAAASPTLRTVEAVNEAWVRTWMAQWGLVEQLMAMGPLEMWWSGLGLLVGRLSNCIPH